MSIEEREPTPDQLEAMAYVDGELNESDRQDFERRLGTSAELAREVAQLRRLEIMSRQIAVPEPADYEWARLATDPIQRVGLGLGWILLFLGSLAGVSWIAIEILRSEMQTVPKLILGSLCLGFLGLFAMTLRARLRTLPYDPYTEVQR